MTALVSECTNIPVNILKGLGGTSLCLGLENTSEMDFTPGLSGIHEKEGGSTLPAQLPVKLLHRGSNPRAVLSLQDAFGALGGHRCVQSYFSLYNMANVPFGPFCISTGRH